MVEHVGTILERVLKSIKDKSNKLKNPNYIPASDIKEDDYKDHISKE